MPIALRSGNGTRIPLGESAPFIEVLSADNKLCMLIVQTPDGAINVHKPSDPELHDYAHRYRLDAGEFIQTPAE